MCTTCGCGTDEVHIDGHAHALGRVEQKPLTGTERFVPAIGGAELGIGAAGVHGPGVSAARIVQVERDLLAANDAYAGRNRNVFAARGTLCLNLVSSPGSGKTTLLVRTVQALAGRVAVVEGDQQTSFDADRIRATGAPAVQINTGKGCHLDAHMLARAIERLEPPVRGVLFVENVGNLVCPALFDLGEAHKVAILSVTEGEDKPLKYPDMFRAASLMLVNKVDLLPHLDFDVALCEANARRVNPALTILRVSARTGEGFDAWLGWIQRELAARAMPPAGARAEARV